MIVLGLAAIAAIVALGLLVTPAPFEAGGVDPAAETTAPLPDGLPLPVERFYQKVYGDKVPVIESAVITGRGRLRFGGIRCPARFRFSHRAGEAYHHYIEITLFGRPVLTVNEYYEDGRSRMELPFGVVENEPKVNQGANLALWAESLAWLPALLATSDRVAWEAAGSDEAELVVPYNGSWERLRVWFDPATGLLDRAESMRYKSADSAEKTLWINDLDDWASVNDRALPRKVSLTWGEEDTAWAEFTVDAVLYNDTSSRSGSNPLD